MSTVYKVHPGIGIARVGKSDAGYFIGSETLTGEPFEIAANGATAPFTGYKDANFLVRRQGIRFRVFEYSQDDATGKQSLVGEVTPDKAKIHWSVKVGNAKASGPFMMASLGAQGEKIIIPDPNNRRNSDVPEAELTALASGKVSGKNQPLSELTGQIKTKPVLLGEIATDDIGRLIFVGGKGDSASWETPAPEIGDYLNNDGWFDDVSDGPIDAKLEFADGSKVDVQQGAWVVVAPPDFAPDVRASVTLFDLMLDAFVQANRALAPQPVSFPDDIQPILERTANLRWVNRHSTWTDLADVIADPALADTSAASKEARQNAFDLVLQSEEFLSGFRLTLLQKDQLFAPWVAGNFTNESHPPINAAQELDLAVLSRCVGSGLFPGIEIGYFATNANAYSELGRFTRQPFADFNGMNTLQPGSITQRMALPWQADFIECSRTWWPVQRPDTALFTEDGNATPATFTWHRGLVSGNEATAKSHLNMVNHFAQLGVLRTIQVGGKDVIAETGRDPGLTT